MTRRLLLLFFALPALLFRLSAAGFCSAGEEVFSVNLLSAYPDEHPLVRDVLRPWAREVLTRTNGRLIIHVFGADVLHLNERLIRSVRLGQIGMGHGNLAEEEGFPLSMLTGLNLGLEKISARSVSFWRIYNEIPEISREFSGVKILALHARQPYQLCMLKDGVYVAEDLPGLTLLTDSSLASLEAELLGASSVPVPLEDFPVYLRDHEADGALLTLSQAGEHGLKQQFGEIALADLESGACWLGMHQGLWDILPQDLRKALADTGGQKLSLALGAALQAEDRAQTDRLRAENFPVHYFSAEERAKIRQLTQEALTEDWQRKARQAGAAAPRIIYDRARRIAAEIAAGRG
ncbi:MAG: hypothetical protein LBQ63_06390 [Deltaproteobacteria bacterium]|jgi:TRAP-type C4-dicarboxylate transport system substrate-binding protein|nr:hypothetical protein [Deltaproteobacteria bacterium]